MKPHFLLAVVLACATKIAVAQAPPSLPPPKFPIKLRAPERGTWTISVKGGEGAPAAAESGPENAKIPPSLRQLVVTKTGLIYTEDATVQNGPGWKKWIFFGSNSNIYQLIKYSNATKWQRLPRTTFTEDSTNYTTSDFEEFEWVDEKNYKGADLVDDRPAYLFERRTNMGLTRKDAVNFDVGAAITAKEEGREYGEWVTVRAWIDPKTLLPLQLDTGKEVRSYAYGAPPSAPLVPPSDVTNELRAWLTDIKSASR